MALLKRQKFDIALPLRSLRKKQKKFKKPGRPNHMRYLKKSFCRGIYAQPLTTQFYGQLDKATIKVPPLIAGRITTSMPPPRGRIPPLMCLAGQTKMKQLHKLQKQLLSRIYPLKQLCYPLALLTPRFQHLL